VTRVPWTRQEIESLIPKIDRQLAEMEAGETEPVNPLPPMTPAECLELFSRLMDAAAKGPLSGRECFLHGQLLCIYRQACLAEAFGKKGRFYVVSEQQIQNLLDEGKENADETE